MNPNASFFGHGSLNDSGVREGAMRRSDAAVPGYGFRTFNAVKTALYPAVGDHRREHGVTEPIMLLGRGCCGGRLWPRMVEREGEMIEREKHVATDQTLIKHGSDIKSER